MDTTTIKLKSLVDDSDLTQLQKNVLNGFLTRAEIEEEKKHVDRKIIEEVAHEKKLSEVVFSSDDEENIYCLW